MAKDKEMEALRKQIEMLKAKQEAAMATMQAAASEMKKKEVEVAKAKQDLEQTEAARDKAGAEVDHAIKVATGDKEAKILAEGLKRDGYAYVDGFLGEPLAYEIRDELLVMHAEGQLKMSELAGGKTGANLKYSAADVRGDVVRFVSGDEEGCKSIKLLQELGDQIVRKVQDLIPEMQSEEIQRGKMMCTCYPGAEDETKPCGRGGPCNYVKHCDNPDQNGRRLTALFYLNPDWIPAHGGALRIYPSDSDGTQQKDSVDIAPRLDRFLLFWSDKRCPHEVLPAKAARYAVTIWYYSAQERQMALEMALDEQEIERSRIEAEIARWKERSGSASTTNGYGIKEVTNTGIPGVFKGEPPASQSGYLVDLEELD